MTMANSTTLLATEQLPTTPSNSVDVGLVVGCTLGALCIAAIVGGVIWYIHLLRARLSQFRSYHGTSGLNPAASSPVGTNGRGTFQPRNSATPHRQKSAPRKPAPYRPSSRPLHTRVDGALYAVPGTSLHRSRKLSWSQKHQKRKSTSEQDGTLKRFEIGGDLYTSPAHRDERPSHSGCPKERADGQYSFDGAHEIVERIEIGEDLYAVPDKK